MDPTQTPVELTRTLTISTIPYHTILTTPTPASLPADLRPRGLILLTHALMADSSMWDSTVAALTSHGFTCLRFDHIGHGGTSVPASLAAVAQGNSSKEESPALHFDEIARHMYALVKAATGNDRVFAVVGCSMGGVLALRFAMLYPKSIDSAGGVVACDPPGATSLEAAKPLWPARIAQFERDVARGEETLCGATVERWIPFPRGRGSKDDGETVAAREKALRMVRRCRLDGYRVCADGIRNYDYEGGLGKVKARAMVLVGALDEAVGPRSVTEGIARNVERGQYVWLEGAGHLPPIHRPREFERILLEFLEDK